MKIAIVSPCHIQPSKMWVDALDREAAAAGADVIIVDDSDGKVIYPKHWRVYSYTHQKGFLGEHYDTFARLFHKSSACRVFGHLVAYREKYDVIIGLDSDCVVPFNFVQSHVKLLGIPGAYGWTNPIAGTGMYSRGYPYSQRGWKIGANMGLWQNVLDLNGKDRRKDEPRSINVLGNQVAVGPLPFSGMNFAMRAETVPAFLFLPNFKAGEDEFRRIDDVWGGLIYYHILRKKREAISFGQPIVFHDTHVVPAEDAAEEAAMYKYEDRFVEAVEMSMTYPERDATYAQLFEIFTQNFTHLNTPIFQELHQALEWWVDVNKK